MAKKTTTSSAVPPKTGPKHSRKDLVGKFPRVEHQPAPEASHYRLSEDVRNELVARMKLR